MGQAVLKGGIVGCGGVASASHIPAFRALKKVQIVAVCDQRKEIATETAKRFAIPRAYGDLSQMLGKEKLDFVDICSPPQTHFQLSMQAMEAGLHVLVEKPMALSVSEADEMVSTSQRSKVKLCVVHNFLFTPIAQKTRFLVGSGAIGDLVSVEVKMLARRDGAISREEHWCHSLPGGIFGEYAPHAIYLLSAFLGSINSVRATTMKYSDFPWVIADELKVLLEAENGLGAFTVSCNSPRTSFTMDIFGTERSLHLNNFTMSMIQHKSRGNRMIRDLAIDDLKSGLQLAIGAAASSLRTVFGRSSYESGHRVITQGFLNSIRDNTEPPVTGEAGREAIRILEQMWKQMGQPKSSSPRKDSDE